MKSNDNKLARFAFSLTGSTIATIASVFASLRKGASCSETVR